MVRAKLQLKKQCVEENKTEIGELRLFPDQRLITVNGNELSLTRHEYNILELMMKYPNKVYSKQELFEKAWEEIYLGEDKTINVHISNIRKKIKEYTEVEYIDTVWGIGFRISNKQ